MDPFDQLLDLRQGSSSIVEYIIQFCEITYKVPFDEVMLKDIFRFGLNEPIKSCLPAGKCNCSLKDFFDYAGSSLTVGVSEEGLAESAPEAAPSQELAESAPEAAPSQELAESAPEAAPCQELAESAPEAAPCQELAESAPEATPCQERAEFALQPVPHSSPSSPLVPHSSPSSPLVPPSSPSSPLVPPSSPSSPLVPPSSPSPWILSSLALSERPRDPAPPECPLTFAPPECPLEVVEFTKNFHGGAPRHCSLRPRTRHGPRFIMVARGPGSSMAT